MALKLYSDTDIKDIADAIRAKNGLATAEYTTSEMAAAINAIPTGKTVTSVDCITTVNGNYIGDANGDGEITSADTQTIYSYIAGVQGTGINLDTADVNGDGVVNNQDAIRLGQLLTNMTTGQILARVSIDYSDGTNEKKVFAVDAPRLPNNISKFASGSYTPAGNIDSASGVTINHNLGVVPDLIVFYTTGLLWKPYVETTGAILGCAAFVNAPGSATMAYRNIVMYSGATGSGIFGVIYGSANYGIGSVPTATSFTVNCATNYKLIGGDTYNWIAVKFR